MLIRPEEDFEAWDWDDRPRRQPPSWVSVFVRILTGTITLLTPTIISLVLLILIFHAFMESPAAGLRSLAAAFLPMLVGVFVVWLDRQHYTSRSGLEPRVQPSKTVASFITGIILGACALGVAVFFEKWGILNEVPVIELVWSANLSALIYIHYIRGIHAWPWYLGVAIGFLAYVVFVGLPIGLPL